MEQLGLFDTTDFTYTYRIARNGDFIVTSTVAGVGRISVRDRWLAPAISELQARVTTALLARSDTMF